MPVFASLNFLEDLALVLCLAALTSVIFQTLRQPVVVGYLVAGMLVGPHVPFPLLADQERIHSLSELGVILLMFALGLEFSLRKLLRLVPTAGLITVVQVGLLFWLGYVVGKAFGWTELESIFAGALLGISSTTIIAKGFAEEKVVRSLRDLVFGVTLFEDLVAVILLALLTALATGAGLAPRVLMLTMGRLSVFLAALVLVGVLVVPPVIRFIARLKRKETMVVAAVGICFAFSMIAEKAGYSVALGAFLAGVLVSESGEATQIEELIAPLHDIFGAVFFVSVGMMLDPRVLVEYWPALIALATVVLIGKFVGVAVGALMTGTSARVAVEAGMSMAQIGEFSFIIASVGVQHGATRDFLYSLAIAVSAITTFITPFMIRASVRVGDFVEDHVPNSLGFLQTVYASAMERLRYRVRPARQLNIFLFLAGCGLMVVAIVLGYEYAANRLRLLVATHAGLSEPLAERVVEFLVVALGLLPCFGIWRGSHQLAVRFATSAGAGPNEVSAEVSTAMTRMLELPILFTIVIVLIATVAPFVRAIDGAVVMAAAAIVLGVMTWRSARQIQDHVREAARILVERLPRQMTGVQAVRSSDRLADLLSEIGPLEPVRVPDAGNVVGKTLEELNLRALTGAMVVALIRKGASIFVPDGTQILRPGDSLALAGPSEALAAARQLLEARDAAQYTEVSA